MKMCINNLFKLSVRNNIFALLLLCAPMAGFADNAKHQNDFFDHYYLQAGTYMHYTDSDDYTGSLLLKALNLMTGYTVLPYLITPLVNFLNISTPVPVGTTMANLKVSIPN